MSFPLAGRELVGVYLLLVGRERELDGTLTQLKLRIEKALYERLSIEEFERLEEIYREGVELFGDED